MQQELKNHFISPLIVFALISSLWLSNNVAYYQYIFLFFGLILGSFVLDFDHLIYWIYLKPNLEESKIAKLALEKRDFNTLLQLYRLSHHKNAELIFHHYFFQVILALISFFVFTSTDSVFGMAFLLSLNLHLLVDEFHCYGKDKKSLQNWLFAREEKQLPLSYLKHYLLLFTCLLLIFILLLIKSQI